MLKDLLQRGLLLGVIAGLLITIFDGLFMLRPGTYVPYSYPFALIVFNLLFWAVIGVMSGFLFMIFAKEKDNKEKVDFYWVLFFSPGKPDE